MGCSFVRSMPATAETLPGLIAEVETWLEGAAIAPADAARLMIALDEMLSNIVRHGANMMSIEANVLAAELSVTIVDDGPPFDPLGQPPPDTSLDIDDRAIGGLGIHLVRQMMDEVVYLRERDRNRLMFRKTF